MAEFLPPEMENVREILSVWGGKKVVIIEDVEHIQDLLVQSIELISKKFGQEPADVRAFGSVERFKDFIEDNPGDIDVVIADGDLRGVLHGHEVVSFLKTKRPEVVIIGYSGSRENLNMFRVEGANFTVEKKGDPFSELSLMTSYLHESINKNLP